MGLVASALVSYKLKEYEKQIQYNKAVQNHKQIDKLKVSECCKALLHYFEVINNNGKTKKYTGNVSKLLKQIIYLEKSQDEQVCYNILKVIDVITMTQLVNFVNSWDIKKQGYVSQRKMISYNDNWSKNIMLGHLWILYIKKNV